MGSGEITKFQPSNPLTSSVPDSILNSYLEAYHNAMDSAFEQGWEAEKSRSVEADLPSEAGQTLAKEAGKKKTNLPPEVETALALHNQGKNSIEVFADTNLFVVGDGIIVSADGKRAWLNGVEFDPKSSGLVVFKYKDRRRYLDIPGQAHHLNQNAAFKQTIPSEEGMCIKLFGNAFVDKNSAHRLVHE